MLSPTSPAVALVLFQSMSHHVHSFSISFFSSFNERWIPSLRCISYTTGLKIGLSIAACFFCRSLPQPTTRWRGTVLSSRACHGERTFRRRSRGLAADAGGGDPAQQWWWMFDDFFCITSDAIGKFHEIDYVVFPAGYSCVCISRCVSN